MSYCRWSSDNFECDLYCYADINGGYTTHIANKKKNDQPIGLMHDGKTFNDPTLEAFRARLIDLRGVGYSFPNYVLDRIDSEISDERQG